MIDHLVPEADRANLLRMAKAWPGCQGGTIGNKPRSIRKKGFWRAYRRGHLWILVSLQNHRIMGALEHDLYGNQFMPDRNCPNTESYMTYPLGGLSDWLPKGSTPDFMGADRTAEPIRLNRPYVDERKWYQKIKWLQWLAHKIYAE